MEKQFACKRKYSAKMDPEKKVSEMSIKIVYYSLQGNTDYTSERIATVTGAELVRLKPDLEPGNSGFGMYAKGGWSALSRKKVSLLSVPEHLEICDTLVIGSPVWAGTYTPAIGAFLEILNGLSAKPEKIFLFGCSSSGKSEKMFKEIEQKLNCRICGTAGFKDPLNNQERESPAIDAFAQSLLK